MRYTRSLMVFALFAVVLAIFATLGCRYDGGFEDDADLERPDAVCDRCCLVDCGDGICLDHAAIGDVIHNPEGELYAPYRCVCAPGYESTGYDASAGCAPEDGDV